MHFELNANINSLTLSGKIYLISLAFYTTFWHDDGVKEEEYKCTKFHCHCRHFT